jgi:hypothetical protein
VGVREGRERRAQGVAVMHPRHLGVDEFGDGTGDIDSCR